MTEKKGQISLGAFVGVTKTTLRIQETKWRETTYSDSLISIDSKGVGGIRMGLGFAYAVAKSFSVRLQPALHFEGLRVEALRSNGTEKVNLEQIFFDLPIHAIWRLTNGKTAPYIGAGFSPRFLLGSNREDEKRILLKSNDATMDILLGLDMKFKKFIFSPELCYRRGLSDLYQPSNNLFGQVVASYHRDQYSVSLLFREVMRKKKESNYSSRSVL